MPYDFGSLDYSLLNLLPMIAEKICVGDYAHSMFVIYRAIVKHVKDR